MSSDERPGESAGRFATTHWSVVAAAADRDAPGAREALASLCGSYWYPLYAFIRRLGHDADRAQDLTQAFFARLLEKEYLGQADRRRGRFRAFLRASCEHFLANERDRDRAQKRGGGIAPIPIDPGDAEARYGREPSHDLTPDRLFERRWAITLLDRVLDRLGAEMARSGKSTLFDRLKPALMGERAVEGYAGLAASLGLSEGAVKVAVHRLRGRYRELLREEIGRTVEDPDGIDAEIRDLFAALSG